jgi:DNA-binding beta-propeller fold protein YncE
MKILSLCAAQAIAPLLPLERSMLFKRAIAISLLALGLAPSAQATPVAHRWFYAVNAANTSTATPRGSVSVYDMDNGHGLVKTILTGLPMTAHPRGVVVSTVTNSMYISYRDADNSGNFHVYCLNLLTDSACAGYTKAPIVGSDRLALDPNGTVLYVPTWEESTSKFIYEIDARTGAIIREITTGVTQEHDAQYPLSGPLFQESRAPSGGNNLLKIYPGTSVSSIPFTSTIGPFVVNGKSTYVVANINGVNGFEIADLAAGNLIAKATQPGPIYWPHGIAFNPSETQVWSSMKNTAGREVVAVWSMIKPIWWGMNLIPVFERTINSATSLVHWINFSIRGDYAYIAAGEYETANTLVFNTSNYTQVASLTHTEDMLEVDIIATGTVVNSITAVGDQYGIGRVQ